MKYEKKRARKQWITDWWPNRFNLRLLRQHCSSSNPYGPDFDYAAECRHLDLAAVKKDLQQIMTNTEEWWPADFGHYDLLFVRLAWHSAGSYRIYDGRG